MNERMDILRKYNLWTRGDLYFHRRSAAHRRMGKVGQFLFAGLYRGVRALYQRLQLTDAVRWACHAAFGAIRPISGISLQLSGVYRDKASGTEPWELYGLYEYGRNPGTFVLPEKQEVQRNYLSALKDTILLKDIIQRYSIRDPRLLEDLFAFLVGNASNLVSIGNIVNYFKSQGRKTSYDAVAAT